VVDDAIRFVSDRSKDKQKLISSAVNNDSEHNKKESNEPDYDEDKDQLEEEQEREAVAITSSPTTINQIF
jgi:hypothetical protein